MSLMVAAHRLTGDSDYLERAGRMALRGMAVTESNAMWHQCDSSGRYGFKYPTEVMYHSMLAGVDYATRGGLPGIGLAYETSGRPGLPDGVAVRTWEPSPDALEMEAVNGGDSPVEWTVSASGTGGRLVSLERVGEGGELGGEPGSWRVTLSPGTSIRLSGRWADRRLVPVG